LAFLFAGGGEPSIHKSPLKRFNVVMSPRSELALPGNARVSNGTRCHKNVILIVVNGGKIRMKRE